MFKFNNTHIFTGYLKQLLSSFNLPTCRIYTKDFAKHLEQHGKEDPRVIESFDTIEYIYNKDSSASKNCTATRVNYLKGNELYNYFWTYNQDRPDLNHANSFWKRASSVFYSSSKCTPGLTKTLKSPGGVYDTATHEHLGDYLRFMRDYHNINLMSLYNCFNNKICDNIYYPFTVKVANPDYDKNLTEGPNSKTYKDSKRLFDARDSQYRIYAFPVKLFSDYTIAIDCSQEIEMFCGFYKATLDTSDKARDLITKTYQKINRTFFKQPFLYDKLNVKYWNFEQDSRIADGGDTYPRLVDNKAITRWDIANREQDLKLFIKVPVSCKSSIVVLEGDFRGFNDFKYAPPGKYTPGGKHFDDGVDDESTSQTKKIWEFKQNHIAINFGDGVDLNESSFVPVGKLQLLAFNTGESYPFADRLVEYLSNSVITPIDEIADNIKRVQKVMSQNNHYFKIEGIWEDKMQKILYDYVINSGPIEVKDGRLVDRHSGSDPKDHGYHPGLGHTAKSTLYDILGYVDKETEKWYASWIKEDNKKEDNKKEDNKAKVRDTIQNVDIYNRLYDL
jgi:hypothetical protein